MVLSYYLWKYPYKILWKISKYLGKQVKIAVYIAEEMDYIVLESVIKHLPEVDYIATKSSIIKFLNTKGIHNIHRLAFPEIIIMCRHSTHRFPEEKIIKFGFRHGVYHFKAFAGTKYYNAFNLYFMTSPKEVDIAEQLGIHCTKSIGFPKLDNAFNGSISEEQLEKYKKEAGLEYNKKTIIFSSTWDGSGMSAVEKWADKLHLFTSEYNILVTLHPWVSEKYVRMVKSNKNVFFIDGPDVLPWLMIADVMVGDISSIIGEFCALNKPIVTFKISNAKRIVPEILDILSNISIQIDDTSMLGAALKHSIENPQEKSDERRKANSIMFDKLDGCAGRRAAYEIIDYCRNIGISI